MTASSTPAPGSPASGTLVPGSPASGALIAGTAAGELRSSGPVNPLTARELAISTCGREHAEETIRAGAELARAMAGMAAMTELSWEQRRAQGILGSPVRSPRAVTETVAGVPVRRIEPSGPVQGAYLHLHGGGWALGSHESQDLRLARMADATGVRVLSIGYRMAPEHPYPAAVDDVTDVARQVLRELRADGLPVAIGGESAGAHLAVLALLRLRDEGGAGLVGGVVGAVLTYGAYDLAGTPSRLAAAGTEAGTFGGTAELWLRDVPPERRRDPQLSPLYAALDGLPPARIMVGTRDNLIDDSLMLAARWQQVAPVELEIVAGARHAFTLQDLAVTRQVRAAEHAFLVRCLSSGLPA